jgi:hypothetical protein
MDMMNKLLIYFEKLVEARPEVGVQAMDIVESCAMEDCSQSNSNPVATEFFPTVVRAYGEDEWPLSQRPAVVTPRGADLLMLEGAGVADMSMASQTYIRYGFEGVSVGGKGIKPDELENAFITNIDSSPQILEKGVSVLIRGTKLLLTPPKAREGVDVNPNCGVTFTESWATRFGEAQRYMPFTFISLYLSWITTLEKMNSTYDEAISKGALSLLVGVLNTACEWGCRSCPRTARKNVAVSALTVLRSFRTGKPCVMPFFCSQWRKPKPYTYVTMSDVGYEEIREDGIAALHRKLLSKPVGGVVPEQTRMPFVETSSGVRLQDSALTTTVALRFSLCYFNAVEVCGSNHIPRMREYYTGVLRFLLKNPGRVGRKLAKTVVRMQRLLAANMIVDVPVAPLPLGPRDPALIPTKRIHFVDHYAISILKSNLGVTSSDPVDIARAICDIIPDIRDGLFAVYMEMAGTREAMERYSVDMFHKTLLDVLTHLASASSSEGYSRSCIGTLPVSGYKSDVQRFLKEGIDIHSPQPVDPYRLKVFSQSMAHLTPPELGEMQRDMSELANSKSGGGDRAATKIPRGLATGKPLDTTPEGFSSNAKDMMYLLASLHLSKEYMSMDVSPEHPLLLGLRSVAGRKLRYIYNLPISMQVVLQRMYVEMKRYMKGIPKYALANNLGIPVADAANEINTSIMCAHEEGYLVAAMDASSLDQHIGAAHRRMQRQAINDILSAYDSPTLREAFGMGYHDMINSTLEKWDCAWYLQPVTGAPPIHLQVSSQPSGALTTAVTNTIETDAMLQYIEDITSIRAVEKRIWGDDCYLLLNCPTRDAIGMISSLDAAAGGSGQVMGTIDDSTSGRVVHFLQKLYVCGYMITRRMPIDYENMVLGTIIPGAIGSLLDKCRDICSRGGNADLQNILSISYIVNGSRSTVYGRQAETDFKSMAAPGGYTNQLMIGFQNPNSKLYLELNANRMFGADQFEIDPKIIEQRDTIVGKRVLEDQSRIFRCNVGGVTSYRMLGDLIQGAKARLLYPDRIVKAVSSAFYKELSENGHAEQSYSESVINTARQAVGRTLKTRHLQKQFKELSLIDSGLIAKSLDGPAPERIRRLSSTHTPFKIGPLTVSYSFCETVLVLPRSLDEQFLVRSSISGEVLLQLPIYWHPYASLPFSMRILGMLLGVHTGTEQLSLKTFVNRFSPGEFRLDMTAEEVMKGLMKYHNDSSRRAYLKYIGFTGERINIILSNINDIPLYQQLSLADEFSSLPNLAKSCGSNVVKQLIQLVSANSGIQYMEAGSELEHVINAHFVALLADEINVAHSLFGGTDDPVVVRLPRVTILSNT